MPSTGAIKLQSRHRIHVCIYTLEKKGKIRAVDRDPRNGRIWEAVE